MARSGGQGQASEITPVARRLYRDYVLKLQQATSTGTAPHGLWLLLQASTSTAPESLACRCTEELANSGPAASNVHEDRDDIDSSIDAKSPYRKSLRNAWLVVRATSEILKTFCAVGAVEDALIVAGVPSSQDGGASTKEVLSPWIRNYNAMSELTMLLLRHDHHMAEPVMIEVSLPACCHLLATWCGATCTRELLMRRGGSPLRAARSSTRCWSISRLFMRAASTGTSPAIHQTPQATPLVCHLR